MKQCKRCKDLGLEPKPKSEFNKGSGVDGLQNLCRDHSREANRVWIKANPDKNRAKGKRYRETNPVGYRKTSIKTRLRTSYGLSVEQYSAMFEKQNGECALCNRGIISIIDDGRDFTGQPGANIARVDHCHKTGRIRGLLCFHCNVGLGKFGDSEQGLLNAVRYLRENATAQAQPVAERESASEIEPVMGPRFEQSRGSRRDKLSPFFNPE